MKKILTVFTALFFCFSANAADIYKIDPNHSSITWKASHFGFSSPSGKFSELEGVITLDEKNPQDSSVEVSLKTDSMTTGLSKFDEHLKSADFFNTTKFPKVEFVSSAVSPSGKSAKIRGNLTLLGVTKMITIEVKLNKIGTNPINQKQTVGFSGKATLKRSDFGIKFGLPNIADKVEIEIEIEATLVSSTVSSNKSSKDGIEASEWKIIPENSKIMFQATQDNSPISGSFKKFDGKIIFDKNLLNKSSVEINIDTTSADTSFAEGLETLKSAEWLATLAFTKATFKADKFITLPSTTKTYQGNGTLTIKGKSVPTTIEFTFPEYGVAKARAEGTATIKRSAFGIGNRDVKKANGVQDSVKVYFVIEAEK